MLLTKCKQRIKCSLFALPFCLLLIPASHAAIEVTISVQTQSQIHQLNVERVSTPREMEKGLMYRDSVAPYDGMLFDFGMTQPIAMWMKNTRMPLDMLFIDADGVVAGIHENAVPYSLDSIVSPVPVRYVLELPAGMVRQYGITTQDKVLLAP